MAASPTEKIAELTSVVATLTERLDNALNDNGLLRKMIEEERALGRSRDTSISELRQENAVLRQMVTDLKSRAETWTNRAWGFFVVLVSAVLSLASGLIVTLARK